MIEAPPPTSEPSHHDTGGDPALDHRGPQGAGIEVDEALVHDRRSLGQVGAQPDPVSVGDAHARRHHVVDHAREFVHPKDGDRSAGGPESHSGGLETLDGACSGAGPHDIGQKAEDAVEVAPVGADQAGRQKVEPEVGVGGIGRWCAQVGDDRGHGDGIHVPLNVGDGGGNEFGAEDGSGGVGTEGP